MYQLNPDLENSGVCVVKKDYESEEGLIKRFRKKFAKSGVLQEHMGSLYYDKPSIRRRKKKLEAIRRRQKEDKQRTMEGD